MVISSFGQLQERFSDPSGAHGFTYNNDLLQNGLTCLVARDKTPTV